MDTSHITFDEVADTGKTKVWEVNTLDKLPIGVIKWRSGWRRYVLYPGDGTLWDASCLGEVISFLEGAMDDHAEALWDRKNATGYDDSPEWTI